MTGPRRVVLVVVLVVCSGVGASVVGGAAPLDRTPGADRPTVEDPSASVVPADASDGGGEPTVAGAMASADDVDAGVTDDGAASREADARTGDAGATDDADARTDDEAATDDARATSTDAGSDDPARVGNADDRDTTVLWRGFRHAWSYNHRFNRLGSGVSTNGCDGVECYYRVEHTAASGSGEDDATVRDAYTELSAEGVAFHADSVDVTLTGVENRPKGSQVISGSKSVSVPLSRLDAAGSNADYVAVLNGFDTYSEKKALKVVEFDLGVTDPTVSGNSVTFDVTYRALLDCDSLECKGAAGKQKQQVKYPLSVEYLVVAGNRSRLSFERAPTQSNDYRWGACKNNKGHTNKWFSNRGRHDTVASTFPQNRMNCEQSGSRELDADDYWQSERVSGPAGYSVATVGMQSFGVDLHEEAHFTQWDAVVGGTHYPSNGTYDVRSLPFFKEWSSRPGRYSDAKFSYGFSGEAAVSTRPIVIRLKRGCKRSFVEGGRIHWATSHSNQKAASDRDAVMWSDHSFEFGDQWTGYAGRGSSCDYDEAGRVPETVDRAYLTNPWHSRSDGREVTVADPTRLRLMPSDRFYHEKTNPSPSRTDLSDLEVRFTTGSNPPVYAGYGGSLGGPPVENYSSRQAGIYLSGTTVEAGGRIGHQRRLLRREGSGTTRRVGSGTKITTPGVYGLESVVHSYVRPSSPTPAAGAAATTFEVVDGPGGVYDHVNYRFDGSVRRVGYRWNDTTDQWTFTDSQPNNYVRGTGQNDHTFAGRFRPRVSPESTRTWDLEAHLRWDGSEIQDREWRYDYGTHTLELYACHNPAAGDCSDPTTTSQGSGTVGNRRYGGKSGSGNAGSSGGTRVRPGAKLVGRHRITILPFGPGQFEGESVPDLAGLGTWLVGNERVDVRVVEAGEPTFRYHALVDDGTVTEFSRGEASDPTVRVTVDEETVARIARADDTRDAVVDEYEAGNVSVAGVGLIDSVAVAAAEVFAKTAWTVGNVVDSLFGLVGPAVAVGRG